MFAELPKLLGKNFAVAFFLPSTTCFIMFLGILAAFGYGSDIYQLLKEDTLTGAALALLLIWLFALFLAAINMPILRFYEGYGDYHPLFWRANYHRNRFRKVVEPVLRDQEEIEFARTKGETPVIPPRHAENLRKAIESYPDAVEFILPTRFGNLNRSIEVYSRVLYGLDAIPAWPRLLSIMPPYDRGVLADSKAQIDFCINLSLGGWAATLFYTTMAAIEWKLPAFFWMLPGAIVVGIVGYWLAFSAVRQFGEHIKSAFDLHRGALAARLGLQLPRSAEAESEMWRCVSRMMIYRSPERSEEVTRFKLRR